VGGPYDLVLIFEALFSPLLLSRHLRSQVSLFFFFFFTYDFFVALSVDQGIFLEGDPCANIIRLIPIAKINARWNWT
jgi:hypothetical protein